MRRFFFLLLFMLFYGSAFAQADSVKSLSDTAVAASSVRDSTKVTAQQNLMGKYRDSALNVRKFDAAQWKKIAGKTLFNETRDEQKKKTSSAPWRMPPWAGEVLRIAGWVIIIGLIVFLLYTFGKNISWDKKKISKDFPTDDGAPSGDIHETGLSDALRLALEAGNLKLAVRLYYLILLKGLNDAGRIDWKKDKTNRDYLSELFNNAFLYEEVRVLTRAYELIWYGEHPLTTESFQRLRENFESVQHQIKPA